MSGSNHPFEEDYQDNDYIQWDDESQQLDDIQTHLLGNVFLEVLADSSHSEQEPVTVRLSQIDEEEVPSTLVFNRNLLTPQQFTNIQNGSPLNFRANQLTPEQINNNDTIDWDNNFVHSPAAIAEAVNNNNEYSNARTPPQQGYNYPVSDIRRHFLTTQGQQIRPSIQVRLPNYARITSQNLGTNQALNVQSIDQMLSENAAISEVVDQAITFSQAQALDLSPQEMVEINRVMDGYESPPLSPASIFGQSVTSYVELLNQPLATHNNDNQNQEQRAITDLWFTEGPNADITANLDEVEELYYRLEFERRIFGNSNANPPTIGVGTQAAGTLFHQSPLEYNLKFGHSRVQRSIKMLTEDRLAPARTNTRVQVIKVYKDPISKIGVVQGREDLTVHPKFLTEFTYYVSSQVDDERLPYYLVNLFTGIHGLCTCPDFEHRGIGKQLITNCKHMISARLTMTNEERNNVWAKGYLNHEQNYHRESVQLPTDPNTFEGLEEIQRPVPYNRMDSYRWIAFPIDYFLQNKGVIEGINVFADKNQSRLSLPDYNAIEQIYRDEGIIGPDQEYFTRRLVYSFTQDEKTLYRIATMLLPQSYKKNISTSVMSPIYFLIREILEIGVKNFLLMDRRQLMKTMSRWEYKQRIRRAQLYEHQQQQNYWNFLEVVYDITNGVLEHYLSTAYTTEKILKEMVDTNLRAQRQAIEHNSQGSFRTLEHASPGAVDSAVAINRSSQRAQDRFSPSLTGFSSSQELIDLEHLLNPLNQSGAQQIGRAHV